MQADKLTKIQQDLDETKIILHKTIESVLDRGEKLDQVRVNVGAEEEYHTNCVSVLCSWWIRVMIYRWRVKCFTSRLGKRIRAVILCD